jgi:integrase
MVKYLIRKNITYWYRRKINNHGEVVFSLKTKNHDIALLRHSYIDYKINQLIYKGSFDTMTVSEIRQIIAKYKTYMIEEEYNDFEDTRDKELSITINGRNYGGHTAEALEQEIQRYKTIHEQNNLELVKQETGKILKRSNLQVDLKKLLTDKDKTIFHWELFKAEWDLLHQSYESQKEVVPTTEVSPQMAEQINAYYTITQNPVVLESINSSLTISELLKAYIKENQEAKDWSDKNGRDLQYVLGHLSSYYNDKPINELTRENFSRFRDNVLRNLPCTATKKIYRNISTIEIIKIVKNEKFDKIGLKNINKHLRRVHQVFEWACNCGYIEKNLTKDLKLIDKNKPNNQKTAKIPYTNKELKLLFEQSPWYTTDINITLKYNPEHIFIPLLCLFSGAKPTELAMLQVSDIKTKEGVKGIEFNDHVKNNYNLRFTPLSQILLDIGFLEYVKYQKKQKQKQLFPAVKRYISLP